MSSLRAFASEALRDEAAALREEVIANRERLASTRERAIEQREILAALRETSVLEREATADGRDAFAHRRDALAVSRDERASQADEAASARDLAAVGFEQEHGAGRAGYARCWQKTDRAQPVIVSEQQETVAALPVTARLRSMIVSLPRAIGSQLPTIVPQLIARTPISWGMG